MNADAIFEILEGVKNYEQGITVLKEGSVEQALEMYASSNPHWAGCPFARLPRKHQCGVLDLAAMVEV